jgi:hypothetical protein
MNTTKKYEFFLFLKMFSKTITYCYKFLLYMGLMCPLESIAQDPLQLPAPVLPSPTELVKYPSYQKIEDESALLYTSQERKKLLTTSSSSSSLETKEVEVKIETVAPNIPSAFSHTPSLEDSLSPLDKKKAITGGEYLVNPSDKDYRITENDLPFNSPITYVGLSFSKPW